MNVKPIAPAAPATAYAAINATTTARNARVFPVGTRVLDFSTGAHGRVQGHVEGTAIHSIRLDNGAAVTRYPSTLEEIADRPRGNGRLTGGVEVWA